MRLPPLRAKRESTSASLLPETAEEVWNEPQNPQILLHLHCGEHPDRLHYRLCSVWASVLPLFYDMARLV